MTRKIYSYSEVKEKIEEEMDLQSEVFMSDQEFLDATNEAINYCEAEIIQLYQDYFLTSATISLVSGTKRYSLPSDIFANKIRHIQWKNGQSDIYEIKRIKLEDKKYVDETSTTAAFQYDIENDLTNGVQLTLYPTPQTTDSTSVTMWYLRNAKRVTALTDTIDIPEFIEVIFAYLRVRVSEKEKDYQSLQGYKQRLSEETDRMRTTLDQMIPNEDTTIRPDLSFYQDFDGTSGVWRGLYW